MRFDTLAVDRVPVLLNILDDRSSDNEDVLRREGEEGREKSQFRNRGFWFVVSEGGNPGKELLTWIAGRKAPCSAWNAVRAS